MIIKIVMIVLMFAFIVIAHEWGHFIAARKNGVLVHEFAIGMGPKLWGIKKGETLYSIRAFPIGGFCSMEDGIEDPHNERGMSSKKPWQKLIVVAAGAIMNFILAWVLMSIIVAYTGYQGNTIDSVSENMPAAAAGLKAGDTITEIDGISVKNLDQINAITNNTDKLFKFQIKRSDGTSYNTQIRPQRIYLISRINKLDNESSDKFANIELGTQILSIDDVSASDIPDFYNFTKDKEKTYTLQVVTSKGIENLKVKSMEIETYTIFRFGFITKMERANILQIVTLGFKDMLGQVSIVWQSLGMIVSGEAKLSDMSGIVGVVDISSKAWDDGMQKGTIYAVLNIIAMAAFLSANLGVVNLLPLPALDGGRIVFIILEMLRGKPVEPEKESAVHFIGLVLLMMLTVVVLYYDIMRMRG